MTCPASPASATQGAAGPSQGTVQVPSVTAGRRDLQQGEGNSSTLVACLSPHQTLEHSCQGKLSLPGEGHLQQSPVPAGSSLLGMAGCVPLAVVTRGGWQGGDTTLGSLPPRPQQAEHREAEQGRALCWHAGTCWGGEMPTPPEGGRLLGHCTAALCSFCCSWQPDPKNFLAKRGNKGFTYSLERCVQFVQDPMVLMGHGPIATFICPTAFCSWEMTVNRISQRLELLLWPPLLALSMYVPGNLVGTAMANTTVCW